MAERPLDRLLPGAIALLFGTAALSAGAAGIVADAMIGRPSRASGVGLLVILPLAVLAAVIGFALGHVIGLWVRRRDLNPQVPMKPYRIVFGFVLGVATVIGATFGARPVLRHERLYQPHVMIGASNYAREDGAPASCIPASAYIACDSSLRITSNSLPWNARNVVVACTREGRISISDGEGGAAGMLDLTAFDHIRRVHARAVRGVDGRESLALLASLRAAGTHHMLAILDADGRPVYQELLRGPLPEPLPGPSPLSVCELEDPPAIVVELGGSRLTYRAR